jgi:hypothetical protein
MKKNNFFAIPPTATANDTGLINLFMHELRLAVKKTGHSSDIPSKLPNPNRYS